MRKSIAVVAAVAALLAADRARAADHIVAPEAVKARLGEAASERARDLAAVGRVLSSPLASSTAARMGVDVACLRHGVASLNDRELRELATRAEALRADPAAGLTHDVEELLIIFLIVAIVILVLKAVA